ncbi:hypothetical protein [Candidatus Mesenet endosymbiont of Phosphuga atrata]|uniref:hypothetical protein n=1 Tax=Candidatus Mesenet endosymbiont of Phosphuga atrata TaxID=3066221 RepID=UPI0030D0E08E
MLGDDGGVHSLGVDGVCCIISLAEAGNIGLSSSGSSLLYKLGHDSPFLRKNSDDDSDIILTFSLENDTLDFDICKDRIEEPIPDDDFGSSSSFGIISSTGMSLIKDNTGFFDVDKIGDEGIEDIRNDGVGDRNNGMCINVLEHDSNDDLGVDNSFNTVSSVEVNGDESVYTLEKQRSCDLKYLLFFNITIVLYNEKSEDVIVVNNSAIIRSM